MFCHGRLASRSAIDSQAGLQAALDLACSDAFWHIAFCAQAGGAKRSGLVYAEAGCRVGGGGFGLERVAG